MKEMWVFFAVAAAICAGAALHFYRQRQRIYYDMDKMLGEILDNKEITQSDLEEGEIPALAGKLKRIQEKVEYEVGEAKKEKEQVKSLISNMSHQLKTPLANIMLYEEILEEEHVSVEERRKFLRKMRKQSEKVSWILNSLFKMVKLEQNAVIFEAGSHFIRQTLLDAVSRVYDQAERKQIAIETEAFPDCYLWHNPKWTAEVFENILENAVKYTPPLGKITVGMRRFEMYTEIWIQDTGIGIAEKELTEVFKRFYRSKAVENEEGSGIGLYLSKMILEKEKGYMNVASEVGKGSRFSVFLQNCQQ